MKPRQAGLSLIELVAALAIFAIVAVMTQQGVAMLIRVSEVTDRNRAALTEVQRTVTRMARDLESTARRPILTEDGQVAPPLLIADEGRLLEFTRGGLDNPAALPRSNFQRIAYRWTPGAAGRGALERLVWPQVDRYGAPADAETEVLLDDVADFTARAWTADTGWTPLWRENGLPQGVDVSFDVLGFGRIRRVVSLR
jgi:general secretion pathway protein J